MASTEARRPDNPRVSVQGIGQAVVQVPAAGKLASDAAANANGQGGWRLLALFDDIEMGVKKVATS